MASAFVPPLQHWLPSFRYEPNPAVIATLARFLELLVDGQHRVRLVGSTDPEVLVRRHVGESIALLSERALHHEATLDLGSGAGFPGLVLAIATPGLQTTLVESNGKKARFLESAVAALGLGNRVQVKQAFLERRPTRQDRAPLAGIQLVTVRALEHMEEVPGWLHRWLDANTEAAFWVSDEMASTWRTRYPDWTWGHFSSLPGTDHRGILLARTVSRETPAPPSH